MIRNSLTFPCSAILAITVLCAAPNATKADGDPMPPVDSCASGFETGFCADAHNDSVAAAAKRRRQRQIHQPQPGQGSPSLDDQRARQTAEQSTNVEAPQGWGWDLCVLHSIGKEANSAIPSDYECTSASPDGNTERSDADRVPTTEEILYAAVSVIHADGAGLRKRPDGVSYTNKYIPTLVSVTNPTQTHVINLLGHDITVTLTATSYTWSWGDGTPDLTTTSPGMPWQEGMDPNTDPALIRHYYKAPNGWKSFLDGPYPSATRTITLTTTWAGTATNPFTGDTQTINGLVTTTETTGPFPLGQLIVNNTDTSEEKQGH